MIIKIRKIGKEMERARMQQYNVYYASGYGTFNDDVRSKMSLEPPGFVFM